MFGKLFAFVARLGFIGSCVGVACSVAVAGVRYPLFAVVLAGIMAWFRVGRHRGSNWTHGSARTATMSDLERRGMLDGHGLILGRCLPEQPAKSVAILGLLSPWINSDTACRTFLAAFFGKQWMSDRMIRLRDYVNLATYAPAGAGKGVSCLVPNLRSYRGSCIVTDPKGELFKLTAKHRKKLGQKVIRIDPFGVCGPGSDTLNPLDFIDPKSEEFLDQCRDLANMMIVRSGQEKEPFWTDSAELNLTGFIAFTCGFEPKKELRTLQTVRGIASSRHSYSKAIEIMQQIDACQGVIRRLGGLLTWYTGEALSGVLSTFQQHTAWMDSPIIARNTAKSSFDPLIIRKRPTTVYLILPADRLSTLSSLNRMWIGTIMQRITSGTPTEKNPVLWFLDEMAHIGHMRAIEDAVTLKRGMGMRLWFFFQSIGQLKACFGEHAPTIIDNIGTSQYFGITSLETAKAISEQIGEFTVGVASVNDTTSSSSSSGGGPNGPGGSRSHSRSTTRSDIARKLLKPEEILGLDGDMSLVFHKNMPVITARLLKYYSAPEFKWGRSGKQRGLGLAAVIFAALTLAFSLFLVKMADSLPHQRQTAKLGVGMSASWPQAVGGGQFTPTSRTRANYSPRPAGRGF